MHERGIVVRKPENRADWPKDQAERDEKHADDLPRGDGSRDQEAEEQIRGEERFQGGQGLTFPKRL